MNFEKELIANELAYVIKKHMEEINPDIIDRVKSRETEILSQIQKILSNYQLNDFEVVEEIVVLFEKHNLSCGNRHDF